MQICAGAPTAVRDMQLALQDEDGLYKRMPYVKILDEFRLSELVCCRPRGRKLAKTHALRALRLLARKMPPWRSLDDKAKKLKAMAIKEILGLKFFQDKFQSGAIEKWVGEVCAQLQSYVKGRTANEHSVGKESHV